MKVTVVIPFRLREGADPRRAANLDVVAAWWHLTGLDSKIVSDGLDGDAQFNRHRAYNRAVSENPDTEIFVFAEADMLIRAKQIDSAVAIAFARPGLVVPFTRYRYLSDSTTDVVREGFTRLSDKETVEFWARPPSHPKSLFSLTPESTMDNGRAIGAVSVVSRETLEITGGFTEATSGNWYDDNITEEGFAFLTGTRTAFIQGPAVHLYHLPGHRGDHLTDEDRRATSTNKTLLMRMRRDIQLGRSEAVKKLMQVRR